MGLATYHKRPSASGIELSPVALPLHTGAAFHGTAAFTGAGEGCGSSVPFTLLAVGWGDDTLRAAAGIGDGTAAVAFAAVALTLAGVGGGAARAGRGDALGTGIFLEGIGDAKGCGRGERGGRARMGSVGTTSASSSSVCCCRGLVFTGAFGLAGLGEGFGASLGVMVTTVAGKSSGVKGRVASSAGTGGARGCFATGASAAFHVGVGSCSGGDTVTGRPKNWDIGDVSMISESFLIMSASFSRSAGSAGAGIAYSAVSVAGSCASKCLFDPAAAAVAAADPGVANASVAAAAAVSSVRL